MEWLTIVTVGAQKQEHEGVTQTGAAVQDECSEDEERSHPLEVGESQQQEVPAGAAGRPPDILSEHKHPAAAQHSQGGVEA